MPVRRPSASSRPSPSTTDNVQVIVPRHNTDPVWSLRPWPAVVNVGGEDFEVPAYVATEWLVHLMADPLDLDSLIEELIPGLMDRICDLDLMATEAYEACLELVACVAARPWWIAVRMATIARQSWHILGPKMLESGANPNELSLAAWMDVLLVSILGSMDPKETTMFTLRLEAPPPSIKVEEKDLEMDRGAFLSMGG